MSNSLPKELHFHEWNEGVTRSTAFGLLDDLLSALKSARDAMARMDCGSDTRMGEALEQVEKAIAKAEGGGF